MQTFEIFKSRAFFLVPLLFLTALLSVHGEGMYSSKSLSHASYEGGVEETTDSSERVYTLSQLETLSKSLSPRYIRYIDWEAYGTKNGVMKKGILFTFSGYQLKKVSLAGDFNNWELHPMKRNRHGIYFTVIPVKPDLKGNIRKKYHYKFFADGIWTEDSENKYKADDGLGGYISEFYLDRVDVERQITAKVLYEAGSNSSREKVVEFAIYLPEVSNLSVAGNFNSWNPEHDILTKDENGIFRLKMRLKPGQYIYKFIADGRWILDKYNPDTKYESRLKELCSYITVD